MFEIFKTVTNDLLINGKAIAESSLSEMVSVEVRETVFKIHYIIKQKPAYRSKDSNC